MIGKNLNYNYVPQNTINYGSKISTNTKAQNSETQKPTLQNMTELYKLWNEAEIVYFPAFALTESMQKRTEALNKYIKDNNLNIDSTQNLEDFFAKVKEETFGKYGIMGTVNVQNEMFMDYIENGYDPTARAEAVLKPSMDEFRDEYNDMMNNKLELKPQLEDVRNNYQLIKDLESINTIIQNNNQTSFDVFK